MREFVTFSSKSFSKAPKPHDINRVCRCEDLAVWLQARLADALPDSRLTSYQEDFGWVNEIQSPGQRRPVMVVATNIDEDEDDTDEFGVYVEGEDAAPGASRDVIIAAVDQALRHDPTIERIEWWDRGFKVGEPSPGP